MDDSPALRRTGCKPSQPAEHEAEMTLRIATLVGSLRETSINRRFTEALIRLAPDDLRFEPVAIGDLPLFNQDVEAEPSEPVDRFRATIRESDGVLFVTPEYNRSIPGVLKNAIDHGSRPYGQSVWAGKPAGIVGVSVGKVGTAAAQQHLRAILAYLDMPTLGQPEAFIEWTDGLVDEDGRIGEGSRHFAQDWMDRFSAWMRRA
jgi:chromate reductase, NAD(P)H dehydrogenase (quinone)